MISIIIATCWLLSKAKAVQYSHCQQISAGKDRAKIRIIKKQRGERVGKRVAYHLILCHWLNTVINATVHFMSALIAA